MPLVLLIRAHAFAGECIHADDTDAAGSGQGPVPHRFGSGGEQPAAES